MRDVLGSVVVVRTRCTPPGLALLVLHSRAGRACGGRDRDMSGDRLIPRPSPSGIAGRLFALADAVRRLPPPGHRDPEAFHIAKSDLSAELRRVAHDAERSDAP